MISAEKIDKIIDGLETSANEFKNVTDLGIEFDKSIDKVDNILKQLQEFTNIVGNYSQKEEKLDLKVDELNNRIIDLISKLQDIRADYHKVSTSYEIVEGDLLKFNNKIDSCSEMVTDVRNQTLDIIKQLQNLTETKQKIEKVEKKINILGISAISIGIIILICVILGLVI